MARSKDVRSDLDALLGELRALLRARNIRQSDLSAQFGVSRRTVSRWLSSRSVPMEVIEKLANVLDLTLFDLCALASKLDRQKANKLTINQEQLLVDEPIINYLFTGLLRSWSVLDLQAEMTIPEPMFVDALAKMDRAGLIELLPYNEAKLLTARDISWIAGGPYSKYQEMFLRWCVQDATVLDYEANWVAESVKLSAASREIIRRRLEELRSLVFALNKDDRVANAKREWAVIVLGCRIKAVSAVSEWQSAYSAKDLTEMRT